MNIPLFHQEPKPEVVFAWTNGPEMTFWGMFSQDIFSYWNKSNSKVLFPARQHSVVVAQRLQCLRLTWYFGHGLAPPTCRTRRKLPGLRPSAAASRRLLASGPAAQCRRRAGRGWTAAPGPSSVSSAPPPPAATAPAEQTSSPPSGSNHDHIHGSLSADKDVTTAQMFCVFFFLWGIETSLHLVPVRQRSSAVPVQIPSCSWPPGIWTRPPEKMRRRPELCKTVL